FIPGGFDRTPTLLELGRVDFGEMISSIALHVNRAELHLGTAKQTLGNGQQTREIIVNDEENAAQTPLNQAAQDQLPVFQILAAGFREAGQHSFLAIPAQTDDQVNTGGVEGVPR